MRLFFNCAILAAAFAVNSARAALTNHGIPMFEGCHVFLRTNYVDAQGVVRMRYSHDPDPAFPDRLPDATAITAAKAARKKPVVDETRVAKQIHDLSEIQPQMVPPTIESARHDSLARALESAGLMNPNIKVIKKSTPQFTDFLVTADKGGHSTLFMARAYSDPAMAAANQVATQSLATALAQPGAKPAPFKLLEFHALPENPAILILENPPAIFQPENGEVPLLQSQLQQLVRGPKTGNPLASAQSAKTDKAIAALQSASDFLAAFRPGFPIAQPGKSKAAGTRRFTFSNDSGALLSGSYSYDGLFGNSLPAGVADRTLSVPVSVKIDENSFMFDADGALYLVDLGAQTAGPK